VNDRSNKPVQIPVPGLRSALSVGQAVKRLTSALGVRHCAPCAARARLLDKRAVLVPMRKK
jgi:hypothetical protein